MADIISSKEQDLKAIAVCHKNAFPTALSSAMGIQFVTRMLDWYLVNDHAFLFHLEVDGKVIGYCGGIKVDGTQATGSASGMAQHSFGAAVSAFLKKPWLLFHREIRRKYKLIGRNILYKLKFANPGNNTPISEVPLLPHVGLVVIGIDPDFQGQGYSRRILEEFETQGKLLGANSLRLTVLSNNTRAINAYKKSGWKISLINETSVSMFKIVAE